MSNLAIDWLTKKEVLAKIENWVKKGEQHWIATVNPEFVVAAGRNRRFAQILAAASLRIPDGIGLIWARWVLTRANTGLGRFFWGLIFGLRVLAGGGEEERLPGVELMAACLHLAKRRKWRVFLLGGKPGVAQKVAARFFGPHWQASQRVFVFAGRGDSSGDKQTRQAILTAYQKTGGRFDLLFVAYGMGKQEAWIKRNLATLPVKVAVGVGGAFDYLAGVVPRAPHWWRRMGLEWLFRLLVQPWRWRRQTRLLQFVFWVLRGDQAPKNFVLPAR